MNKDFFYVNNIKYTNQRYLLTKYAFDLGLFSLKDLSLEFKNINKSTIYRTIDLLLSKGLIEKEILNNEIYYRFVNNHNHYLICKSCNKKIIMDKCPFEIVKVNDFIITKHSFVVEGFCRNCK